MASPSQPSPGIPGRPGGPKEPPAGYFIKLSRGYRRQTGDCTLSLLAEALPKLDPPIDYSSVVHDNAAGPGTASLALMAYLNKGSSSSSSQAPARLEITDSVAAMIDVAAEAISSDPHWASRTKTEVMDSTSLDFPDDTFSHSITNFSIFTFSDAVECMREVRRTLKSPNSADERGGLAVVTTWKRWAVSELVHKVQRMIRPDAKLIAIPHPEFFEEQTLPDLLVEAGFERNRVRQFSTRILMDGEKLAGLRDFMLGDFTGSARLGWSGEEIARWQPCMDQAIEEEIGEFGGVMMEAWVVTATK